MPQLYENQIQAKASQNPYGKAPQIENYIGKALENVANLSDAISQDLQRAEDARLKMEVDAKTKQAMDIMERADPEDFDYTSAIQEATGVYNSAFDGANNSAIRRFNRSNPEHAMLFDLATNKIALEKSRDGIFEKFKREMDTDSSRVALGDLSREEYYNAIDTTNMTNAQKAYLKDAFDKTVVDYKMFAYLSQDNIPSLKEAQKVLNNNKDMSLERRLFFAERINNKITSLQEKQKKEKTEKDSLFIDNQIETYLTIKNTQGKLVAEEYANDLAKGRIKNSDGSYIVLNTMDPSKADYISLRTLNSAVKSMRESAAQTDADLLYKAEMNNKAESVISYNKAAKEGDLDALSITGVSNTSAGQLEFSRNAYDVMNSPIFNELSNENKKAITDVAMEPYNKINEVLGTGDVLAGVRTERGRNWLGFRRNIATYSNTILSSANTNDADSMAKGIASGRKLLEDEFLDGEMGIRSGSNSYALHNAYVAAKTLLKNRNNTEKLGVGGISNDSLDRAYGAMVQGLLISGQYNSKLEENDDGTRYFDQFVVAATGEDIGEDGKKTELYKTIRNALRTANKYSAPENASSPSEDIDALWGKSQDVWEIKR